MLSYEEYPVNIYEKGSRVVCFLLFELEEIRSMPRPSLTLACVLAVLAAEAGFRGAY